MFFSADASMIIIYFSLNELLLLLPPGILIYFLL
jgi:hypothetical protein